ncbi:MAG: CBS domain-containing protein [Thermomicrobiales bacterium]|nr:CBS domain-containing protein [Thermomicrobiales bacterium]
MSETASGDGGGVTVAQIMRRLVPAVGPDDSIAVVARTISEHGLPGVPVVANGELLGIVTEGDIVFREAEVSIPSVTPFFDAMLVADAGTPFEDDLRRALAVTAGELMSAPVYTIRDRATLQEVATLMSERRVNPVPVVDDLDTIVGIVTRADLVRIVARLEQAGGG